MNTNDTLIEQGSGPPIIFVHGSYSSPAAFKSMVSVLAERHRCIRVTLPGHAGVPIPGDLEAPTFDPEFEVLEAALRRCGGEPAHLVGHSYGGGVAMAYALRQPDTLRAMTLFEPGVFWILRGMGDRPSARALDRIRRALRRDIEEGVPFACGQVIDFWGGIGSFDALPTRVKETMSTLERVNLRHWDLCKALERGDRIADYHTLTLPTRLVHGSASNPIAYRIVTALASRLRESRVVEVEGASHFLVTTHSLRCAHEVLRTEDQRRDQSASDVAAAQAG